jgi:predicted cupin superfamily sugar epimerase
MNGTHSAEALIEQLALERHPEGGWYRETWRAASDDTGRANGTAILFLLKTGESSHWHRVDADELWLWQSGDPLELGIASSGDAASQFTILGPNIAGGHALQGLVPAAAWQAARSMPLSAQRHGYSLVSCVVVPGFDFAGFELAPPEWAPGKGDPV